MIESHIKGQQQDLCGSALLGVISCEEFSKSFPIGYLRRMLTVLSQVFAILHLLQLHLRRFEESRGDVAALSQSASILAQQKRFDTWTCLSAEAQ